MTDCILSVDIGTTSLKAAYMTDRPGEVFVSRQFFSKRTADEWNHALARAVSELNARNKDYAVEAVCISGNGPTIVSSYSINNVTKTKTLLYNAGLEDNLQEKIRNLNTSSLFIPRLYAFKELYPEDWKFSKYIFSGPEYLIYEMTGCAVSILPEARYTRAYWTNDELLRCGFSKDDVLKLPPFVSPGSLAGKINEQTAIKTGLLEGTLVFAGGPDFTAALIGTGTVFPGRMCDRAGSSEGINLCTQNPVYAEGLRTLPSVIPGLWNVSRLLENREDFGHAVEMLREAAENSGEYFPKSMIITGGQALNKELVLEKEKASGMKIQVQYCADAELIGDLILARVGLGDYDSIEEAVMLLG